MLYTKNIKKYSHCQYLGLSLQTKPSGFFTLEFVYTFFVVTAFIWVISLYISMSIHWQTLAANHLIALNKARSALEQELIDSVSLVEGFEPNNERCILTFNKHQYSMPTYLPRFGHNELSIESLEVSVLWNDDKGNSHEVQLQSYS